ncbi:heavy metal-associated isoprenylated plant protein 3-like [Zingiber officinale]|uniref:heavy metal-associated isoprenylated plant protein 3-like n=1 Tax=Zingiber officinale TaxID=94328 RepID=UPI001C4C1AB1|nr:heavy metal-associated isoprenylated plant protein 3-like [Zingiber officinale]
MVVVLQGKSERMTVAAKTERKVEIRDRVAVKTETKVKIREGVVVKTVRKVEVRDRVLVKTEKQVEARDRAEKKLEVLTPAKSKPESDNKKIKAATVALKVELRCSCQGHTDKIRKAMKEIKGVENVAVDAERNLVTVQGTMNGKALPAIFEAKLNWKAEVVEPKKEKKKDIDQQRRRS